MSEDNVVKSVVEPEDTIFSKNEIDVMSVEDVRAMLYHYQLLLAKSAAEKARLLQELQDARAASAAQFQFLKNMAHEMRNVLGAVAGAGELLSRGGELTEKQGLFLDVLKAGADTLRHLVRRVMEVTKSDMTPDFEVMPQQLPLPYEISGTKRHKILLVEDEPSNVLIISTFLENLGYDYEIASTGCDVLQKVISTSYSLILMDLSMPEMDGIATTQELRRMEKEGLVLYAPIIAMTAHALIEDRQKCLDAGMDDYIAKPFTETQLHEKVEQNIIAAAE